MRLATWNVNSITARLPRLLDWLETRQPADEPGFSDPEARESPPPVAGFESADLARRLRSTMAAELARYPQSVLCGDFNVAPTDADI